MAEGESKSRMIKMSQKNMYKLSKKQWNPFVGCEHGCIYCVSSFQRQLKRQGKRCRSCYDFTPHEHPSRLSDYLPNTNTGEFIFTCSNGDVTFCSTRYLKRILKRIEKDDHKTFQFSPKPPRPSEESSFLRM
jgi:DNA repair photolyase